MICIWDADLEKLKKRKKELFDNMADDAKHKEHAEYVRLDIILSWLEGR